MLGAGAAWRAANKSAEAARDARDALAASLKPQLQLFITQYGGGEPVVARAVVVGTPAGLAGVLPATDVLIQFNLASGKQGSASTPILRPTRSHWARDPPYLNVVIGEPSEDWPPPDGDHVIVTVLFSDVRNAASYQLSQSVDLRRAGEPGLISFQNPTPPTETRITP